MFSWLFGGGGGSDNGNNSSNVSSNNTTGGASSGGNGLGSGSGSGRPTADDIGLVGSMAGTAELDLSKADARLDPSVFERIAKAAESIKSSDHAADLLKLANIQEETWQKRFDAAKAEAEAKAVEEKNRQVQLMEEERRRSMAAETEQQQKRAQYQDQLARQRYNDQLKQQEQLNETERRRQEQSTARQEQERRRTVEYQSQLQRETELAKAKADSEARIRQERENRDIRDEQLTLEAEEYRKTVLEGIKAAGRTIGDGISEYLSDTPRMLATVGVISGIALGVYAAKSGTTVATQAIVKRISTPPLVRETSRSSNLVPKFRTAGNPEDVMRDIIFPSEVEQRLQSITIATANTRRNRANYRNMLLHGPPGTGKTMFGRRLAQQTGLEYAIMAGGDVGPLGKEAVTELHKVFDWAERSNKGLVLFIDEAEAFLRKRSASGSARMSEEMRNALSTFLYRTGSPSDKFMIVLSSNEPQELDRAVLDRVDEAVHVGLPELPERVRLLNLYYKNHILEPTTSAPVLLSDDMQDVDLEAVARKLEGFSGRQIAKLCVAWQATANATVNNMLTKELFEKVLNEHMTQHKEASTWITRSS